jgi:hypothetical protein
MDFNIVLFDNSNIVGLISVNNAGFSSLLTISRKPIAFFDFVAAAL